MRHAVSQSHFASVRKRFIQLLGLTGILVFLGFVSPLSQAATVSGNTTKWSPITLDFIGVEASETDTSPNPFLDYRLTVIFTAPSGQTYTVPGFFAGDGNGNGSGNHWQVRFAASEVGTWQYSGVFHSGSNIAIDANLSNGNEIPLDNAQGDFFITAQSASAAGFLKYGRLSYVGEHYLKFSDGPYWVKAGTDSPENMLGYAGFDNTIDQNGNFLHRFENHVQDARDDDPVFSNQSNGVDGRGLTGALNYLSDQGVNSIYFLPMNLGGDGQETYPFVGGENTSFNKTHYDISKLHQWNEVLKHAQRRGIALNIQLSETEVANERWLDNGNLGVERKLFFRELIARFGYLLAAKWNLGEENDYPVSEIRAHADYIRSLDWSAKPIAVHTQINNFRDYEEIVGEERFSASSIQYDWEFAGEFVEQWRTRSTQAGHPWVIDMDENTNGLSDTDHNQRRKQILYDVLFSGGNIEWYFGLYNLPLGGDTTAGDFRLRESMWQTMRFAREFMENELPFWRMQPMDSIVSNENQALGGAEVFGADNEVYAVYLPNANGGQTINLQGTTGTFIQQWFNPVNGQFEGNSTELSGNQAHPLGTPPSRNNDDWVLLIRSTTAVKPTREAIIDDAALEPENLEPENLDPENLDAEELEPDANDQNEAEAEDDQGANGDPSDTDSENEATTNGDAADNNDDERDNNALPVLSFGDIPVATRGRPYSLMFTASDADGVAPAVTADTLPPQMTIRQVSDGVFELAGELAQATAESVTADIIAIDSRFRDISVVESITISVQDNPTEGEPVQDAVDDDDTDSSATDTADTPDTPDTPDAPDAPDETEDNINAASDYAPIILGVQDVKISVGTTFNRVVLPVDSEGIVPSIRVIGLPSGATFDDNGNGTRTFSWTPTDADIGEHSMTFVATDAGPVPHVVQQDFTVTVVDQTDALDDQSQAEPDFNFPPIFHAITDKQVSIGDTIIIAVKPIDPEGHAPILHVANAPLDSTFNDNDDGSRTFEWVASGEAGQLYNLEFIAIDSDDATLSTTISVSLTVIP